MRFLLPVAGLMASVLGATILPPDVAAAPFDVGTPDCKDNRAQCDTGIQDFAIDSPTIDSRSEDQAAGNDCSSRKTCTAMVQYFEHTKYNGNWYYFGSDESELDSAPNEGTAICHPITNNFLSSIKLRPRQDGRKWGCILYADSECKGQRNKGEAVYINESRDRFPDWNDKTRSIKCFMEY